MSDDTLDGEVAKHRACFTVNREGDGGKTIDVPVKGFSWVPDVLDLRRPTRAMTSWPAEQMRNAVEERIPAPYVGPPSGVEGPCHVSKFVIEYVWHEFAPNWSGYHKRLLLCVKVRPRGDETDPKLDERGLMKLWLSALFSAERPDAVCIRELFLLALRHELEESIMVNGVRIWDPHVGRPGDV